MNISIKGMVDRLLQLPSLIAIAFLLWISGGDPQTLINMIKSGELTNILIVLGPIFAILLSDDSESRLDKIAKILPGKKETP